MKNQGQKEQEIANCKKISQDKNNLEKEMNEQCLQEGNKI